MLVLMHCDPAFGKTLKMHYTTRDFYNSCGNYCFQGAKCPVELKFWSRTQGDVFMHNKKKRITCLCEKSQNGCDCMSLEKERFLFLKLNYVNTVELEDLCIHWNCKIMYKRW